MMRGKSPPPEIIFRENQVEQLFGFVEENFEREIYSFFCQNIFLSYNWRLVIMAPGAVHTLLKPWLGR